MSAEATTDIPPQSRMVHHREYSEALDLLGHDLISQLGRPKMDVAKVVGTIVAKSEMHWRLALRTRSPLRTPTGSWPKAQGCRVAATLGLSVATSATPT